MSRPGAPPPALPPALEHALEIARLGRLYPSIIVHGGSDEARREAAALLGRTLLCERAPEARPCGVCRHCRRIVTPAAPNAKPEKDENAPPFHPDFAVLGRDLKEGGRSGERKTVTGAEATRDFLGVAHLAPFEARGQVFVLAEAHTLSAEAGDALLKLLEEPGLGAPRHFLLLAPTRLDLSATLRSRSMSLFLGASQPAPEEEIAELAAGFLDGVVRYARSGHGLFLLEAATRLCDQKPERGAKGDAAAEDDDGEAGERSEGGGRKKKSAFDDPRAETPWVAAASAVRRAADAPDLPAALRRPLLDLADDLLGEAPPLRLRGIPAERIVAGLVSRRLTAAR